MNDKINKNDALNQSVKKEKQELKKKIIKSISRKKRTEGISLSKIYDRFIKLCFNSFSETGYPLKGHKIGTLDYAKIPFTFKWTELKYIGLPYPYYIGGFGPLFGGILLLSFLIFSLAVIISFRRTLILACILVFILMSVLITSIGFYPRYAPQFWLVPVFVIPVVFYIKNNKVRILAFLLLFELLFNMRLFVNEYYRAQFNATEKFQIKYSRLNKKKSPVKIYFFPPFRSAYKQRFNKMGIKYYEVNDKSEADRYVKRLYWSEGVPRYRW